MNWSDASSTCRLEWRRSRWMLALLAILGLAACASPWLSNLPRAACDAGDAVAVAYSAWLLYREIRRKPCVLARIGSDPQWQIECEGRSESARHVGAIFRGGLVVLTVADDAGRHRRFVWWPDTLGASGRRALRLAAREVDAEPSSQPMLATRA
jgi:toxin CptA